MRERIKSLLKEKYDLDFSEYVDWCLDRNYEGDEYSENHHILPVCEFPEYSKCEWNIITLKYSDHKTAHIILAEICPIRKFVRPLNWFSREKHSELLSIATKNSWIEFKKSNSYDGWRKIRSEHAKTQSKDRMSEMSKKRHSNLPEGYISNHFKTLWKDPEYRKSLTEKISRYRKSEEGRKRASELSKEMWNKRDDEFRKRFSEQMSQINQDPASKKKNSDKQKERWADPFYREKQIEIRRSRNYHWYNDGNKELKSQECPENFVKGRLKRRK